MSLEEKINQLAADIEPPSALDEACTALVAAVFERALADCGIGTSESGNHARGMRRYRRLVAAADWFFDTESGEAAFSAAWCAKLVFKERAEDVLAQVRRRILLEWDSKRVRELFNYV